MGRPRTYPSTRSIEAARKKARKGGWVLKKQRGTPYVAVRAKKAATTTRRSTTRRSTTRRSASNDGGAAMRRRREMGERMSQRSAYENSANFRTFSGKRYAKWTASFNENEAKREAARVRKRFSAPARVVKRKIQGVSNGYGPGQSRTVYVVYRGASRNASIDWLD